MPPTLNTISQISVLNMYSVGLSTIAGKIRSIRIREQGVPFKVVMQHNGYAKLVATEELDAEMMSEYRFSIFAVDNGTRARKSERSRVYCYVIDVNEFAPIFKHPTYEAEIQRGRAYGKIVQVRLYQFFDTV